MRDVDLGEPTSFVDHVYFMFETRTSAGAMEKLPEAKAPGKLETYTNSS